MRVRGKALILLAWCLASCSAKESEARPTPTLETMEFPGGMTGYKRAYADAENNMAACMRRKGFSYTPFNKIEAGVMQQGASESEMQSLEYVRLHGFGIIDSFRIPQPDPNTSYGNSLISPEQEAFFAELSAGNPKGCHKSAYDLIDTRSLLISRIDQDALTRRINADPAIRRLDGKWLSCMNAKGYPLREKSEMYKPFLAARGAPDAAKALTNEIRTATASLVCEKPLSLNRKRVTDQIEEKFAAENKKVLFELHDILEKHNAGKYASK
jgi:hypothetical protein